MPLGPTTPPSSVGLRNPGPWWRSPTRSDLRSLTKPGRSHERALQVPPQASFSRQAYFDLLRIDRTGRYATYAVRHTIVGGLDCRCVPGKVFRLRRAPMITGSGFSSTRKIIFRQQPPKQPLAQNKNGSQFGCLASYSFYLLCGSSDRTLNYNPSVNRGIINRGTRMLSTEQRGTERRIRSRYGARFGEEFGEVCA